MTIIGIDLGTTNSVVAAFTPEGPKIIPNSLGQHLTPSIISVEEDGEVIVGEVARQRLITHPHLTASVFKRYMGTNKIYQLGDYQFTPEDLSSFVLRSLKEDAEAYLGTTVTEAVISVPAYFNDAQRQATRRAGLLAGLKVERLINEPTAAAVAYGLHLEDPNTRFLVFDLGGGTFDVSILERFEDLMEVQAVAGDNYLGGEDFTELLFQEFISRQEIGSMDLEDHKLTGAIRKQAEAVKVALSQGKAAVMELSQPETMKSCKISGEYFENLAKPLLMRLRQPIERAVRDAAVRPSDLDAIILVGGATRMPIISSFVARMFNRLASAHIDPDETVAIGAAIQAGMKARDEAVNDIVLTDVCPYTLGVGMAVEISAGQYESGHFSPIIERNSVVPVSKIGRYYTINDGQTSMRIDVYQGESRLTQNNIALGEFLVDLPSGKKGDQAVDIRFTYDINGILEVETTIVSTGEKKQVIFEEHPGQFSKEQIEQRFKELSKIKIHPRDRMDIKLLLARGERLYEESLGRTRDQVAMLLRQFEDILNRQDDREIRQAVVDYKAYLDTIERGIEF
ncbi:molecular chaperone HscC [Paenibacillus lutimineralis]|uniref:Chaperone protein DnaK n=1 Tax=Paenibacillus lutimineralis TaxID=2707005 RepID=A0A3Q9I9C7_9BACL|nr:molecular chaperone HscC [Paenibacillus lutimineralis]AZS15639.1 molecular chaperone HscC [Paenibacillus lutimineralis]